VSEIKTAITSREKHHHDLSGYAFRPNAYANRAGGYRRFCELANVALHQQYTGSFRTNRAANFLSSVPNSSNFFGVRYIVQRVRG